MRRVVWSQDTLDEFFGILQYTATDNHAAAERLADAIEATVEALSEIPTGRQGRVVGTCEKVVTGLPYIIAYALASELSSGETLTVHRIIHGARNWSPEQWPEP